MKTLPGAYLFPLLILSYFVTPCIWAEEQGKSPKYWIEILHADDFDQRQHASEELVTLGAIARPELEIASHDSDPDVRNSVAAILAKIDALAKINNQNSSILIQALDIHGTPLAKACGEILLESNNIKPIKDKLSVQLDENGRFMLPIHSMGNLSVYATFSGYSYELPRSELVVQNGFNYLVLNQYEKNCKISGKVEDEAGHPIKDSIVTLFPKISFDPEAMDLQVKILYRTSINILHFRSVTTDEQGKWALNEVPEGIYTCIASDPGRNSGSSGIVRLSNGAPTSAPTIVLKQPITSKVRIKLVNLDGTPLIGENVEIVAELARSQNLNSPSPWEPKTFTAIHMNESTNKNGCVEIGSLGSGHYQISARLERDNNAGDLFRREIEISDSRDIEIEHRLTSPQTQIDGQVTGEEGKEVPKIQIYMDRRTEFAAIEGDGKNHAHVQSDDKGFYHAFNLAPGNYDITFCNQ